MNLTDFKTRLLGKPSSYGVSVPCDSHLTGSSGHFAHRISPVDKNTEEEMGRPELMEPMTTAEHFENDLRVDHKQKFSKLLVLQLQ